MKNYIIKLDPKGSGIKINKEIYGHFSEHLGRCIYGGLYVGKDSEIENIDGFRKDVFEALKELSIPVLRWPGGCFADEYHWQNGIGELSERAHMINTNWGGVTEDNSFGTHEFMNLCEMLGCEPYIAGNLGSGTVRELSEWVEYMTSAADSPMANLRRKNGRNEPWKLKYLGIGNESWGCGGNMRPEYYSDLYKHYQTFCKNYDGNNLVKVACGPSADDYNWTRVLLENVKPWHTQAISLHYYTVPTGNWDHKGSATDFSDKEYYSTIKNTLFMDELLRKHIEIMDELDPDNKIKLFVDEWGIWCDVEPGTNPGFLFQQNSMRDAIIAAINLNLFNNYAERVTMANIAQVVNVLQATILTEGDKLVKTPTYYAFKLFKAHQDAELIKAYIDDSTLVEEECEIKQLSASASTKEGKLTITLSNADLDKPCELTIDTARSVKGIKARIITGEKTAYNSFGEAETVFDTEFSDYRESQGIISMTLPALSVVALEIEL